MLTFYLTLADTPEEKSKLETLYVLYKKRMWYVANQILNDNFNAEDAVHNAFVGIAKNIDHIKDPESTDAFAYVITATKHAALNIATRNHNIVEFDEYNTKKASEKDFLAVLENKMLVLSALKKLPDNYRELLYFHYYMDMSEKDISTLINRKYPTVRKQISRAKQLLADLIAKEDSYYEK